MALAATDILPDLEVPTPAEASLGTVYIVTGQPYLYLIIEDIDTVDARNLIVLTNSRSLAVLWIRIRAARIVAGSGISVLLLRRIRILY